MRGAVSLAAALAIPLEVPNRDLLIFLTFVVILVTLVGQGLTLAPLIRLLGVADDGIAEREDESARARGRRRDRAAGRARGRGLGPGRHGWRLRGLYGFGASASAAASTARGSRSRSSPRRTSACAASSCRPRRIAVVELRRVGKIADDVMHRVLRDIALEVQRLDAES